MSEVITHELFIAGSWVRGATQRELHSPFDGVHVADVHQVDAAQVDHTIAAAHDAFTKFRKASAFIRGRLLHAIAAGLGREREAMVKLIVREAGKPRTLADGEVGRAIGTFTMAAEEARRHGGELLPVDLDEAGRAYGPATVRWQARGPVLAIAPFNFPINLVAHKVAPALAVGASVIVKPPPQAPGAATLLAKIFERAGTEVSDAREQVPPALLQVINGANEHIGRAIDDSRIAVMSFTGSDVVGWKLAAQAARKKVALELGGNAAVIVHADGDLQRAATRIAWGAFAYAGQVCISVQRVLVQESALPRFRELLLAETAKVGVGDPDRKDVLVGPVIDSAAADRIMRWFDESLGDGAKALVRGERKGNVIGPTIIEGAKKHHRVRTEELFGPGVLVDGYASFDDALVEVNDSRFGLQAGLFTDSQKLIARATDELDVGGLIINDVPTYRADNMPYGGNKDSGLGREGVRYAMEDLSERKVVVTWRG